MHSMVACKENDSLLVHQDNDSKATTELLYIQGLTRNVNEGHLREIFSLPPDANVSIERFHKTGISKGCARIMVPNKEMAHELINLMHGGIIDGQIIKVFLKE